MAIRGRDVRLVYYIDAQGHMGSHNLDLPRRVGVAITTKCMAPIRICDLGGWTDTWFAGTGNVLNIAIFPSVEATIIARRSRRRQPRITIFAKNYEDHYSIVPHSGSWTKHPLIEAAFELFELPPNLQLEATVFSEAPGGASTGTSAAVTVAILGALELLSVRSLNSQEIARNAHRVESQLLGLQSGIQDQISSAHGGINFIEMRRYPEASVTPIILSEQLSLELESRLLLIYLGKAHQSSDVHCAVIRRLEESPKYRRFLQPLREAATEGRTALLHADLDGFGQAMMANTAAQRSLHPELLGKGAQRVIEIASQFGVAGFKLNGAGGEGGSLTLLLRKGSLEKHQLIHEIENANPAFRQIPVRLAARGLRRWKTEMAYDNPGLLTANTV